MRRDAGCGTRNDVEVFVPSTCPIPVPKLHLGNDFPRKLSFHASLCRILGNEGLTNNK